MTLMQRRALHLTGGAYDFIACYLAEIETGELFLEYSVRT